VRQGTSGGATEHTEKVRILEERLRKYELGWPPGHFYSPIPSLEQVSRREKMIWSAPPRKLAGIELGEEKMVELFRKVSSFYSQQPWSDHKRENVRYYFVNDNYSYGEALVHFGMMREFRPRRVIEIGSGFSSCVTLDTNELFFDDRIQLTFIEPYPALLYSLMKAGDAQKVAIVPGDLQDVDPRRFEELEENDILFVDSTHVSKVDSDVNHIIFDVLPRLKKGVIIHFHDICYPFEYPKAWIYQGRAWNETYMLRAFLQYNAGFEILMFNSFMGLFYPGMLSDHMPLMANNAGSSIWLIKK